MHKKLLLSALALVLSHQAFAKDLTVDMMDLATGKSAGKITLTQSKYGVVFTPMLQGVAPGLHGFHVHENASCAPLTKDGKTLVGGAAGGHYDPDKTGKHGYPWADDNHRGDLPPLYATTEGMITNPVLGPRLTLKELPGHSLMIHVGGDNHSDMPAPLGGGGARMICGVIK